ncbi:hypothetical protein WJX73_009563 [Symbiochloris irregularis]|uniref:Uncharacterized protein n=1 Tax=Symbiochloris irregularis TaxID=706552 RepID=A0AAW1PQV2_9CHLO
MSFARRLVPFASRLSQSDASLAVSRQSRRSYADAHGEVKVNCWEAPTQINKWKEEHIVFAVLGTWGVVIFGSMKIFGGKKPTADGQPDGQPEASAPSPAPAKVVVADPVWK